MEEKKWFHKKNGIILLIWLIFPLGLYLMWKESIFTKKIRLFVSLGITSILAAIIYSSLFVEPDPDRNYKEWTNKFDQKKSKYCNCISKAKKSTRNIEKQDKAIKYCHIEFQSFYEEFEDATHLTDEEFEKIDQYVQQEYNKACK